MSLPFAVCRAGPSDNSTKKLLPRPPPPPRPPPGELPGKSDEWYPGKYMTQLASTFNQKIDEMGISNHATELTSAVHSSSSGGISSLFPNTTAAIARERESRRIMSDREVERLELWWRRQLISEGGDFGGPPPPPSDSRHAFESRLMHPASKGILRIALHFVTEFLENEVATQIPAGRLPDWTLPTLVGAFLTQIEGMLAAHPLWRQEFAASSYAKPHPPERMSSVGHPSVGGSSSSSSARLNVDAKRKLDLAWEATLDELEDFVFRKIGSALLPAPPAPLALGWGSSEYNRRSMASSGAASTSTSTASNSNGAGSNHSPAASATSSSSSSSGEPATKTRGEARYGDAGSGETISDVHHVSALTPLPLQRLRLLGWLRSHDLGVPWAGFDEDSDSEDGGGDDMEKSKSESHDSHLYPSNSSSSSSSRRSAPSSFSRGQQSGGGWALAAEQLVAFGGPRPPREKLASLALCFDLVSKQLTQVLRKARLHATAAAAASASTLPQEGEGGGDARVETSAVTNAKSATSRERTSSSSSAAHHNSRRTIPRPRFDSSRSAFEDQMRSALTHQLSPAALAVADAADGDSLGAESASSSFVTSHGETLVHGWDDHSGFQWRKTPDLNVEDDDDDGNGATRARASSLRSEGHFYSGMTRISAAPPASLPKRAPALSFDANSFLPSSPQALGFSATGGDPGEKQSSAEAHDEDIDKLERSERRAMPANPEGSSPKRDSQEQPAFSVSSTVPSGVAAAPSKDRTHPVSDCDVEAEDLPSADDVLPAAILVLLRAAPQLAFNPLPELEYALSFRSRARLSPEAHYFGVTLCSAAQFLGNLRGLDVGLSPSEFEARMRTARANEVAAETAEALGGESSLSYPGAADSPNSSESSNERASSIRAMQNRRGSWDGGIGGERSSALSPRKQLGESSGSDTNQS